MLVKKARVFPVECIVRGYLAGSGWKEYQRRGHGLRHRAARRARASRPARRADLHAVHQGRDRHHDENISFERMVEIVGRRARRGTARRRRSRSTRRRASTPPRAASSSPTPSSSSATIDGALTLVDEVLTPDSSRFWPADEYEPGHGQPSFDKQYVRDWLEASGWDKTPPAPRCPPRSSRRPRRVHPGLRAHHRPTFEPEGAV